MILHQRSDRSERLLEVRDQVLRGLQAHGQADQAVRDAGRQTVLGGDVGVGHAGGMLDQGVGVAQRDSNGGDLQAVQQLLAIAYLQCSERGESIIKQPLNCQRA